jgi:hypothetical protein
MVGAVRNVGRRTHLPTPTLQPIVTPQPNRRCATKKLAADWQVTQEVQDQACGSTPRPGGIRIAFLLARGALLLYRSDSDALL